MIRRVLSVWAWFRRRWLSRTLPTSGALALAEPEIQDAGLLKRRHWNQPPIKWLSEERQRLIDEARRKRGGIRTRGTR